MEFTTSLPEFPMFEDASIVLLSGFSAVGPFSDQYAHTVFYVAQASLASPSSGNFWLECSPLLYCDTSHYREQ